MNDDLISVIVAIYNVEDYLPKCIDSIINQSFENLEIILVNDGSTDSSGLICEKYSELDDRIVVIHKENGGLSSARNVGLNIASGNLVAFVDSDDYIDYQMYEKLYNNMNNYNSDIAICDYYYVKNKKINKHYFNGKSTSFYSEGKEKFINLQNQYDCLTVYSWNKLYKKYIFDNIRFPNGRIFEDSFIICDILNKANRVSYIIEPLYFYVYRTNSIVNSFSINHFDKIGSFNKKISFFKKNEYYDLITEENNRKAYIIIYDLAKVLLYRINDDYIYRIYYNELVKTSNEINWINSSRKVKLFKIFKNNYIRWNCFERRVYYYICALLGYTK